VLRLVPLLLVLACAVAGASAATASTLTLTAPAATRFGHRIEFTGRLVPAVPGARIRLYRRDALVTTKPADSAGRFRIPVRIERPGPFYVAWAGATSARVTIRIHPLLEVQVTGARVAGRPLALSVRLRPAGAGPIHVRVTAAGATIARRTVYGAGRVAVATQAFGPLRILLQTRPAPGYESVSRMLRTAIRPPLLAYGVSGPTVTALLRALAALHYAVPRIQATFDGDVLESVYAFQKVQGLPRTGTVSAGVWARLGRPLLPRPRYRQPERHLEVDRARQVLFVVQDGEVVLISPVSTAGIAGYYTPVGRFAIYRKVPGYDPSPLGVLYKPMYFTGGYAVHGNPSVPPYPASHGCVRVPNFVIERLYRTEPYGETVYVY
jgi:N-acetylmuramoyl-L-alanine amidase